MKKFPTVPVLILYWPENNHSLTVLNGTVLITHYSIDNFCAADKTCRGPPFD